MTASNLVFLLVVLAAAGFFSLNVQRLIRYLRIGRPEERTDHPARRLLNVLTIGLGQAKILRDPVAGAMHALVFWGFVVLAAGSLEVLIQTVAPSFSYGSFLPGPRFALYWLCLL